MKINVELISILGMSPNKRSFALGGKLDSQTNVRKVNSPRAHYIGKIAEAITVRCRHTVRNGTEGWRVDLRAVKRDEAVAAGCKCDKDG